VSRIVKSTPLKTAGDMRPPRDTAGKPPYTPPAAPRDSGGLSTGTSGGNFDAGSLKLPNSTPTDLLDKPGTGNP
jgi:hypothetical protein